MNIYPQGFYVYAYLRKSDNTPYYIGKGSNNRAWSTHSNIKKPKNTNQIVILHSGLSENDAWKIEENLILQYGRRDIGNGILENKTNGGEGPSGAIMSEDSKIKMSQSAKTRWADPKKSKSLRKERKSRFNNPENKIKVSKSVSDLWKNDEYLEKQRISRSNPEYINLLRDRAKNRKIFTCVHCGKGMHIGLLNRWHNDNCFAIKQ